MVFGDSIAHGLWDPAGGWVQRLRTYYDKKNIQNVAGKWIDVYNLGVDGDVAKNVVTRLAPEMKARQFIDKPIIIIAIGINDTLLTAEGETSTPEEYVGEIEQIVAAARQFTEDMLFVGLTAVDESLTNPWKFSAAEFRFTNDRIWQFEEQLRQFCATNKLPIVKVFEVFQRKLKTINLLEDGLHPNSLGHRLIGGLVRAELQKLLTPVG